MDKFEYTLLENNILNGTIPDTALDKYCAEMLWDYAKGLNVTLLMKRLYQVIASNQQERSKVVKHYMSVMKDLKW